MIIEEINRIRRKLNNVSSPKELAFYQILDNQSLEKSSYLEEIYTIMLMTNDPITKELINKHRETQPIVGFHYSTTLIELVAMAMDDFNQERDNLETYCQNHSTRDFFILKTLFPDITSYPPEPQGSIDQIAKHLYEDSYPPEDWRPLILKALCETSDLVDLYIIEIGIQKAMDDNPILHRINDIIYVRDACNRFVQLSGFFVKIIMVIIVVLITVYGLKWLTPIIINNWDQLEPWIFIVQLIIFVINLSILFIGFILPKKNKVLRWPREKLLNIVFIIIGFSRSALKESLSHLENEDDE